MMGVEMKESGLKCFGLVPKYWKKDNTKKYYKVISGYPYKSENFSLEKGYPLVRIRDIGNKETSMRYDGELVEGYTVEHGDILVGLDGGFDIHIWRGGKSLLNQRVAKIDMNEKQSNYFYYALKIFLEYENNITYSTTVKHLSVNKISKIVFCMPTREEMRKISVFLDEKITEIEKIIKKTEDSIKELEKYKESMIYRVVIGNMSKNIEKVKINNIWIKEIPKEWEKKKTRQIGFFSSSGIDKLSKEGEEKVKIVNYVDVYKNKERKIKNDDYMVVTDKKEKILRNILKEGDMLFTPSSETTEDIGVSVLIAEDLENTAFSYHLIRFEFKEEIDKEYKKYLFNNKYVQNYFSSRATGSIRKTLNREDFKELELFIPTKKEQKEYSLFLDKKTKEINSLIDKKIKLIEELKKYKNSLIYEYVTGKKEVK